MNWSRKPLLDEVAERKATQQGPEDLAWEGRMMLKAPSIGWGVAELGRLEKHEAKYFGRRLLALSKQD